MVRLLGVTLNKVSGVKASTSKKFIPSMGWRESPCLLGFTRVVGVAPDELLVPKSEYHDGSSAAQIPTPFWPLVGRIFF